MFELPLIVNSNQALGILLIPALFKTNYIFY
jgi:hypothetical protein